MYDSVTARFMQEDTYTGQQDDPLSLNLYTYCHNEPVMYSDPSGHGEVDTDGNQNVNKNKPAGYSSTIAKVQTALNIPEYHGLDCKKLTVDGISGPNTKYAISCFQKNNGLSATGDLDSTTLSKILNILEPATSKASSSGGGNNNNNSNNATSTTYIPTSVSGGSGDSSGAVNNNSGAAKPTNNVTTSNTALNNNNQNQDKNITVPGARGVSITYPQSTWEKAGEIITVGAAVGTAASAGEYVIPIAKSIKDKIQDTLDKGAAEAGAKIITTTETKIPTTGEPNSIVQKLDEDGNIIQERYYDSDGRATKDIDYTDHGNPKQHPEVPHEHTWDWSNPDRPIRR